MNHLAHCFLSFGNEDLLIGNFIGDFVKGSAWKNYPEGVQHGILLHRTIDSFTDNHPAAGQSKERVRHFARRYAGAVTDVLYDYLLALHWDKYSAEPFEVFAEKTYRQLKNRAVEMPPELRERLPRMLAGRFLHGYTHREGLAWVLDRFSRRMVGGMDAGGLTIFFFEEIEAFSGDFQAFFPDLVATAQQRSAELEL
jgi:acyl carrier protein phosphodiesterase